MIDNKHIQSFKEHQENLNISDVSESQKEKCWVIRSSEGNVMWVHKTMNDEQLKDYRRQGLYVEEHMLLD